MSQFLGSSDGDGGGLPFAANDMRLTPEWQLDDAMLWIAVGDVWALDGFRTPYWPRGGGLDASGGEWCEGIWYDRPEVTRGHQSRVQVTGITRDAYGTPLGGCTVKLFRTGTDILQDTTVSDAAGAFTLMTPYYPDTHYLVAYKAGVPDVEGTSANTLIGA